MHLPILKVRFPAIALSVFSNFVPVVNFDLLENLDFYKKFLNFLSYNYSKVVKTEGEKRSLQE